MTSTAWHDRAAGLTFDGRSVIDGQRCATLSGQTFAKCSPVHGRLLGPVAGAGPKTSTGPFAPITDCP